jgi:hypothetical protein
MASLETVNENWMTELRQELSRIYEGVYHVRRRGNKILIGDYAVLTFQYNNKKMKDIT